MKLNKIILVVLSFVVFIIPIAMPPYGMVRPADALRCGCVFFVGIVLLLILFIKRNEVKWDKLDLLVLGFYFFIVLSTIFSINLQVSLIGFTGRYEGFFALTTYILIYYFAKYYFKNYKHFFTILFLLVAIISIISILQFYSFTPIKLSKYYNTATGTFGNPNFLGTFTSIFLPMFMALYLLKGQKRYLLLASIVFFSMVCSLTRSAWVAFGICSIIGFIYIVICKNKAFYFRMVAIIICFVLVLALEAGLTKLTKQFNADRITNKYSTLVTDIKDVSTGNTNNSTGSGRIMIWKMCLDTIKLHPILGCGPDALPYSFVLEQPDNMEEYKALYPGILPDKAHNEYLQIAATMGIPALLFYLAFVGTILYRNYKKCLHDNVSFVFAICITSYLIQAFFNISIIGIAVLFWMMLGLSENKDFRNSIKL